jgi:hypothetical protein
VIKLPVQATDDEVIGAIDVWARLLGDDRFEEACQMFCSDGPWSDPSAVASEFVRMTREAKTIEVPWEPFREMQRYDPADPNHPPEYRAEVLYRLGGKWGHLLANIDVTEDSGGLVLRLFQISSW